MNKYSLLLHKNCIKKIDLKNCIIMPTKAAIGAAGNVFSDVVNNVAGYYAQKRQHRYNKELLDKQLALNKEMAQYNYDNFQSPLAQVRGYRDAGLNENLAYSQLSSGQTSAETPEVPQNQAYTYQVDSLSKIGDTINDYYRLQTQKEQIELLKQEVESKKLQNAFTQAVNEKRIEAMNSKNAKETYHMNQTLNYMQDVIDNGGFNNSLSFIDPEAFRAKQKNEMWQKQADWQTVENQKNRIHQLDMQAKLMTDNMRRLILSNEHAKELKNMDIEHSESKFSRELKFRENTSEAGLYMDIAKLGVDALTSFGFGKLVKQGFKLFSKKR